MANESKKTYKYFLYSREQYQHRLEIERTIGRIFNPGKVLSRGEWRNFTDISSSPSNSFADSKIVAEGYIEDMKYTNHNSQWGVM